MDPEQFTIVYMEVNSHSRTIKETMFIYAGPSPQQEHWEVPATPHMGPPPTGITHLTVQAFKPSNYTHPHLTPYWLPHLHPIPSTMVGAQTFLW